MNTKPTILPNSLEKFSSVSFLWTLACIDAEQVRKPLLYRNGQFKDGQVIFSSAGRYDKQRTSTVFGKPEYYINNFKMVSVIANNEKTDNTNVVRFEFEVFEPYSLGTFFNSMQVAAQQNGFPSYLGNTPYVLKLEVLGVDENNRPITVPESRPRFFEVKIISARFNVTEAGSTYQIVAIPFNAIGLMDQVVRSYSDVKIAGNNNSNSSNVTVYEILADPSNENSLVSVLNNKQKQISVNASEGVEKRQTETKINNGLVKRSVDQTGNFLKAVAAGDFSNVKNPLSPIESYKQSAVQYFPDEYEIDFPSNAADFRAIIADLSENGSKGARVVSLASTEVSAAPRNYIGESKVFTYDNGTIRSFVPGNGEFDTNYIILSDDVETDLAQRVLHFKQADTIINIINETIKRSEHVYELTQLNSSKLKDTFIPFYKIDVRVELLQYDPIRKDFAKKFTFRVVPYFIHKSLITKDNSPTAMIPVKKKIKKRYEYIYTGKNTDVLSFNIDINNLFFTANNLVPAEIETLVDGREKLTIDNQVTNLTAGSNEIDVGAPYQLVINDQTSAGSIQYKVARQFFENLITGSSADLLTVKLEILGDLWFLMDSGMSNYSENYEENSPDTISKIVNYEGGEVFIEIVFRNPVDVDPETGSYKFLETLDQYSGIFKVIRCTNTISDNVFKQELVCIRIMEQNFNEGNDKITASVKS